VQCTANNTAIYYVILVAGMPKGIDSDSLSVVSDGHTKIFTTKQTRISLNRPTLIAGFLDSGMIGSVTLNHIIEQLRLHQIASIESEYVMPAAIFVGGKFRHAIRIYSDDSGQLCVLICEVPVIAKGTFSIVNTIVDWCENAAVSEILVLGGILPTNFSPMHHAERKPMLLHSGFEENPRHDVEKFGGYGIASPQDAIIVGLSGSLLSTCAAHSIKCRALLVPTISEAPDPEGAALVLEALDKVLPGLKIDTSSLRQKVEMIKKHMEEFLKMHNQHMHQYDRSASRETEGMYK
jgi:uncharacterized protein